MTSDEHLSPWACSRCNPLECICWCHQRLAENSTSPVKGNGDDG